MENEEQIKGYEKVNSEELKTSPFSLVVETGRTEENYDDREVIHLASDIQPVKLGWRRIRNDDGSDTTYDYYLIKKDDINYLVELIEQTYWNFPDSEYREIQQKYYSYRIYKLTKDLNID
jgi:hypothetical protein